MTDVNLRNEVLRTLLNSKDYVSGSTLAKSLHSSRSTINRVINELVSNGYVISKHPRMGYKIIIEEDLKHFNVGLIASRKLKYGIYYANVCTSTQDLADILAKGGAPEGTITLCEEMSKGRGRLGREWIAGRGGLWFTLVLRPQQIKALQLVPLMASICVAEAINEVLNLDPKVKWPNDVLINERKVAGILVEGRIEAHGVIYLLVGVGVNVNNSLPESLRDYAISLRDLIGYPIPRTPLLKKVLELIDKYYAYLIASDIEQIINRWRKLNSTIGRKVRVHLINDVIIEGLAKDVDLDGSLYIETERGLIKVLSGDVVHLR